ncbi:MAG: COG2426 family protein [Candidatus Nanoarchaeia archaeon]
MIQILIGLLLTITPVFELRAGLPIIVEYAIRHQMPILPLFLLVLILNILIIFFIFFLLDVLHDSLMKIKAYRYFMNYYMKRARKRADKVEKSRLGYLALTLLVAVPLPGTGAWTGTLVAWLLGWKRATSFLAISLGVIIAGLIILGMSIGIFN